MKNMALAGLSLISVLSGVNARADYFELPNVVIDSPETKTAQISRRGDNMCWDLNAIKFRVRNRDLIVNSITVRYENGNVDTVRVPRGRYSNGPQAYGPFDITERGYSGLCAASISISGDDVDGDRTPGRPRRPNPSYSVVDFEAFGRLIVRNERRPEPPVVVIPPPRPAPVYETRVRRELDLNSKELIANPQIQNSFNMAYTVNFLNPESVGAIQLETRYDDAYIDEVMVTFANGTSEKIELGTFRDGWNVRDGAIYLSRNQRTGMIDLMGYGERRVTSISVRGREGGAGEVANSGIKPVVEVYGVGVRTVSEQVCVAYCN